MTTFEVGLINSINHLQQNLWLTSINIILLLVSAGLIFWYAWEARRTADEMKIQNELQTLPFITIKFATDMIQGAYFINIGKGAALNVSFETSTQTSNSAVAFRGLSILEPSCTAEIISGTGHYLVIDADELNNIEITVKFEDILGNSYSQNITRNNIGVRPHKVVKISQVKNASSNT